MRFLLVLIVVTFSLNASNVLGQRPVPPRPMPMPGPSPTPMPMPQQMPVPAPLPEIEDIPSTIEPEPLPDQPATNYPIRTCTEVCIDKARKCGKLAKELRNATWDEVKRWLDYWDDYPSSSPDPPCVHGYNNCRYQC